VSEFVDPTMTVRLNGVVVVSVLSPSWRPEGTESIVKVVVSGSRRRLSESVSPLESWAVMRSSSWAGYS
jgi:hypothetical protein